MVDREKNIRDLLRFQRDRITGELFRQLRLEGTETIAYWFTPRS